MNAPVATADSPRTDEASPRTLDGYRLLRELGHGGMSTVFLGYHTGTDSPVAVKVLADHLSFDDRFVRRFRREGHLAKMALHEHIARGISLGQDRPTGKHYLALEYIDGPSSQQVLDRSGRFSVPEACRIACETAEALSFLSTLHYLHRDVKPANILLESSGRAKLIDFGLAVRVDERDGLAWESGRYGTPYYMPPEQGVDGRVDARGDVYALAATLYHFLTGEVPFPGGDAGEVLRRKLEGPPGFAGTRNPNVPDRLSRLLTESLSADPAGRPGSIDEFAVELRRFRGNRPGGTVSYSPANVPPTTRTDDLAKTQPDLCGDRNELPPAKAPARVPICETGKAGMPKRRWRSGLVALVLCLLLGSSAAIAGGWLGERMSSTNPIDRLPVCPCESMSWDGGLTWEQLSERGPADLASSTAPRVEEPCPPLPEMPALR